MVGLADAGASQPSTFIRRWTRSCIPSFNETFGLPTLEAMACSYPVVTSDTSAMPESAGGGGPVRSQGTGIRIPGHLGGGRARQGPAARCGPTLGRSVHLGSGGRVYPRRVSRSRLASAGAAEMKAFITLGLGFNRTRSATASPLSAIRSGRRPAAAIRVGS